MNLSIVIVSWNTQKILEDCLKSVFNDRLDAEMDVWVVDNASVDGSPQMVREQFPQVKLLENTENVGFARANNQALRQSQAKYYLLLNSDTIILPGALQRLVRFMDENPRAGAVGPMLLNPDHTLQPSCFPYPTLIKEFWRLFHLDRLYPFGIYRMDDWDGSSPRPVDAIQGACLIVRSAALDRVGHLDENYFMYTEELDLCYRLKKDGCDLFWIPDAKVVHLGGQSTRLNALKMFLTLYQTKLYYFRKHYGLSGGLLYKLVLFAASLPRLALIPLSLFEPAAARERHYTIGSNYLRLLAELPHM